MKKYIIIGVLAVLAIILLSTTLYTVKEGEYVYITQFGELKLIKADAGLNLKVPFIQDVNRITKKQMIYNVNPSEVLTADKKAMIEAASKRWGKRPVDDNEADALCLLAWAKKIYGGDK